MVHGSWTPAIQERIAFFAYFTQFKAQNFATPHADTRYRVGNDRSRRQGH